MLVAAGPFLHIPSFTDSDELRKPRRFLGAAGLVLELHDLADKRRLLRPQRHTADPTEHVVVSNPELHARAHHSHHEPAKFATTDLDFLAARPLRPPERIALGRVQIAQPLIRFEHNGFVILESLDLEQPALAFRVPWNARICIANPACRSSRLRSFRQDTLCGKSARPPLLR
jgi:hypothetical protein